MSVQKDIWDDIEFFKPSEFACRCGCGFLVVPPGRVGEPDYVKGLLDGKDKARAFLNDLDYARDIARVPFVVNSGCRCVAHNAAIGGEHDSAHCKGLAADISCLDPDQRKSILTGLLTVGFNRIIIYDDFIHVDDDETKNAGVFISKNARGET